MPDIPHNTVQRNRVELFRQGNRVKKSVTKA